MPKLACLRSASPKLAYCRLAPLKSVFARNDSEKLAYARLRAEKLAPSTRLICSRLPPLQPGGFLEISVWVITANGLKPPTESKFVMTSVEEGPLFEDEPK